jgi:TrmH family RNA methyltransferase
VDGDAARPLPPPDRIAVVLHQPSVPDNVGAVARVMGNTGFSRLVLSDPRIADMTPAYRTAVSAASILGNALTVPDLDGALAAAGAQFVVGSTARARSYWDLRPLPQAVATILAKAAEEPVALLFGPEKTGLTNEELDRCHLLVSIPAMGPITSYNLSHAVLLVLFHLASSRADASPPQAAPAVEGAAADPGARPATREEREGMYAHLAEMLLAAGFLWEENPEHMMRLLREFLNRASPRKREVQAIRGICRTMLWRLRGRG